MGFFYLWDMWVSFALYDWHDEYYDFQIDWRRRQDWENYIESHQWTGLNCLWDVPVAVGRDWMDEIYRKEQLYHYSQDHHEYD